jgi:transcription initiation factor TFIID subunit 9B
MDQKDVQSKDIQAMLSVLKDMGIEEYEPKVINQLLEFSYSNFI